MNLKNQPPISVPEQYQAEIERLSKAALMDMVWNLANRCSGGDGLSHFRVMEEVRSTRDTILNHRKQWHKPWKDRIGA